MSEHSPTPWRVDADTRIETAYGSQTEHEVIAGWNIHDAYGVEIVGCEGILADQEHVARRLVHAVNLHVEMVEALKSVRMSAGWSIMSDETRHLVIAALSKSTPPQEGE